MKKYFAALVCLVLVLVLVGCTVQKRARDTHDLTAAGEDESIVPSEGADSDFEWSIMTDDERIENENLPDAYYLKTGAGTGKRLGDSGVIWRNFTLEEPRKFSVVIHKDNGTFVCSVVQKDTEEILLESVLKKDETGVEDTIYLEAGEYSLRFEQKYFRGIIDVSTEE